jgi:GH25 family lysozyme M1 (1,4-beta-N-acetylmuramidase)
MPKLDQLATKMDEEFKAISGVKVSNWQQKVEFNTVRLQKSKVL